MPAATTADAPVPVANGPTLEQALARLDRSRANLRTALRPAVPTSDHAAASSFNPLRRARAWLRGTTWGGLLDPVVGAASEALAQWWRRQSWYESVALAQDTLSAELSPLVRRYPITAVVVTASTCAVLVGSGVWRWRAVRRSGLQLAVQLRRLVTSQLTSPALQSVLLGALASYLAARTRPASAAEAPARDAAPFKAQPPASSPPA